MSSFPCLRIISLSELTVEPRVIPKHSKHGPSECDGNVQQLCVRDGSTSQKDWWNFIQCQNFENLNRWVHISGEITKDVHASRQRPQLIDLARPHCFHLTTALET